MLRSVRASLVLALALCLSASVGLVSAAPSSGGRDIQSFANAEFELPLDECGRAYLGISFVAGENLQGPIGSGKPGSWSDVTARLNVVDTCSGEVLASFEGWTPVPPTIETFETATVEGAAFAIPGGDDASIDVSIDLAWTGFGPETVRTEHHDGYVRAERTVAAELAGSVQIGSTPRFPDGLHYKPEHAFDARLGWAAEIDTLARPACLPAPTGLTSWWTGDGTTVDRVGGLNATQRGGAGYGRGIVRSAFRLDGIDDHLRADDAPGLDVDAGDFTITAWVRFDTTNGEQVIVEKWLQNWDAVPSEGWTLTKLEDDSILLAVSAADGFEVGAQTDADVIEPDRWYLVTGRRTGSEITVLIDGMPLASSALEGASGWDLSAGQAMLMGRRSDDRGFFLDGSIDEVQLYRGTAVPDRDLWLQWAVGPSGLCR